jgi:hypothetical protein
MKRLGAEGSTVYRNVAGNALWALCAAVTTAIALGEGLVEPSVPTRVAFFVASLVLAWVTVRVVRSGIVVGAAGVEVRGFARTCRASWAEIAGFEFISASPVGIGRSVYVGVRLRNGRHVTTGGLVMTRRGTYAQAVLAELEARRSAI